MDQGRRFAGSDPSLSRQIDLMKGIAILLIVAFHIGGQELKTAPDSAYRILTYQGVQIFFIMSGFGLLYSQLKSNSAGIACSWKQWLIRRFIRIYPLYFLVLFFTLAISLSGAKVIKVSKISLNSFGDFFMHATMLHIFSLKTFWSMNVALWFVGVITFLYFLFPFLNWVLYHWNKPVRLWCISLLLYFLAVTVKTMTIGPFDFLRPTFSDVVVNQMLTGLLLFFHGMVLARVIFDGKLRFSRPTGIVVFFFSLLSWFVILTIMSGMPGGNMYYVLWHLLTMSVFLCLSIGTHILVAGARYFLPVHIIARTITWVGTCSYAIYLVHWGFISPVMSRFSSFVTGLAVYTAVMMTLAFLLTIWDYRVKKLLNRLLIKNGSLAEGNRDLARRGAI